ncbi:MAG: ribosome silencing factor [Candidatus Cloacimonadales bacterium]|jgi:ribosome-associated protein|nr:ribosome silencing factor [Candidatus Cloacimonadota bacterium]MDD2649754.1 ribosome silencing factor [Candidatus Cloacimonadota bacterium]MDD3501737.1 ribosome silencing factor [Candidatus Cloacimonadota bacterium]MDX9977588.1 ribosome silencing factor [Candidatus Cloacimonadales bacterium]
MGDSTKEKIEIIIEALEAKKAENISCIDVHGKSTITDAFIICNGSGELQNRAIAEHVIEVAKSNKYIIMGKEGMENGKWVLIDLGDVIVHIFNSASRNFYKIEELWTKNLNKQGIEQNENQENN